MSTWKTIFISNGGKRGDLSPNICPSPPILLPPSSLQRIWDSLSCKSCPPASGWTGWELEVFTASPQGQRPPLSPGYGRTLAEAACSAWRSVHSCLGSCPTGRSASKHNFTMIKAPRGFQKDTESSTEKCLTST